MSRQFDGGYLGLLLWHASQNVPFYAKTLSAVFENGQIDLNRFQRIPILAKKDIRVFRENLTSRDINSRKWKWIRPAQQVNL